MASPEAKSTEMVFKGVDGNECEDFIAAIEELAFAEGWFHDQERMLLFAKSHLRHAARRWFAKLESSRKETWDSFVEALFDQYPLMEAGNPEQPESEVATPVWSATTFSPAASTVNLAPDQTLDPQSGAAVQYSAPQRCPSDVPNPRAYDPSIPGSHFGVLRIVVEGQTTVPLYVWKGRRLIPTISNGCSYPPDSDSLGTTVNRSEALVVCFVPTAQPHTIGCLNAASKLWDLSLNFQPYNSYSYELHLGNTVSSIPLEVHSNHKYGTISVAVVWNVTSDGSIQASLSAFDAEVPNERGYHPRKEDFKTTEVHLPTSGHSISFVKPGTDLRRGQANRYEMKARIVFEPL